MNIYPSLSLSSIQFPVPTSPLHPDCLLSRNKSLLRGFHPRRILFTDWSLSTGLSITDGTGRYPVPLQHIQLYSSLRCTHLYISHFTFCIRHLKQSCFFCVAWYQWFCHDWRRISIMFMVPCFLFIITRECGCCPKYYRDNHTFGTRTNTTIL